jgi:transcriptional regulator with XRE-family HTH domain
LLHEPGGTLVTARINADRLRHEIAARGLDLQSFARLAGISAATLSHAVNGRPVAASTLRSIVSAMLRSPRLEGADLLLARVDGGRATPPTDTSAAGALTAPTARGTRSGVSTAIRRTAS